MNRIDNRIFDETKCSICLSNYQKEGNDCVLLKCGHIYHTACFKGWLQQQNSCPMCRTVAHLPVLFKDAAKNVLMEGVKGAEKGAQLLASVALGTLACGVGSVFHNYFHPGKWPSSREEWDAAREKYDLGEPVYDLENWSGRIKMGLHAAVVVASVGAYYTIKEVIKQRNAPVENSNADFISYAPPPELLEAEEKKQPE